MNLRLIDWIWNVEGRLALAPGQSAEDVFGRLDPLFREEGTTRQIGQRSLTFTKKDQPAQDRMATFDRGELRVEDGPAGQVLRYRLFSRSLLFCFLAPLLFLAFAQLNIFAGSLQGDTPEAAEKEKKPEKVRQLNPIDVWLGAPAPEAPKKDKKDKKDDKPSPTSAYVFAAIFAALYVGGRILEDWLVRRLLRQRLQPVDA